MVSCGGWWLNGTQKRKIVVVISPKPEAVLKNETFAHQNILSPIVPA